MKAKVYSLIIGLVAVGQMALAQTTGYKMNVKMTDGSFFSVAADDVEEVYFTTTEEHHFEDTYYTVSGRAEKGPFKSGTTVTMQPLDLQLNALGSAQTSMIFDDCGNYAFRNTLFKYPYVSVTATGLFFNEYDEYMTRDTQLTLQGYADLQRGSKVNVNVVTHLISERVTNLVIGGVDFDAALSQAQGELLSAFGLQSLNNKDFTQVSITDGDDYAAALLAISVPLLNYRKGSELISWITRLRYDFADDGKFTEQNKSQFNKDRNESSLDYIAERLIKKYQEYGLTISVKDLRYFYDWDEDGVAGNEIYDPSQPASCDLTNINAPMEGGTYTAHVNCNVPLYSSPLNSRPAEVTYNPWGGFFNANLIWHSEYSNNGVWTIKIDPTNFKYTNPVTLKLYDAIGNVVVSVAVSQDGNPNGTFLDYEGNNYVTELCRRIAQSHGKYRLADAKYTGLLYNLDFKAPLDPYDYNLSDLFRNPYQIINMNSQLLRRASETGVDVLNPMCHVTNALMYYQLVTMFGGVPYITTEQETYSIPRSSADEIFNNLIANLTSVMDRLSDVKAGYINNVDGIAIPPRDLARVILSDIYMYQGKYAEAKALLNEIVSSNRYSLVSGLTNLETDCSEIVWSQPPYVQTRTRANDNVIVTFNDNICIIKTYSDVLLSLAECESKLGNDAKANEYLNIVKSAKRIETTSPDVISTIAEVRSKIQIDFGGYFAFLKRTGLAMSTLGLEEYQLLFPIPQSEINMNPMMTQNPGYSGRTR